MANTLYRTCPLYEESVRRHGAKVLNILIEFMKIKDVNAMQAFGSKDYPFVGNGPLAQHKPRLVHAGMTWDISLVYTVSGRNPHIIDLVGFFTHDELGTGQPSKPKIQKQFIKKVSGQKFT
jgi:hypothetical protein